MRPLRHVIATSLLALALGCSRPAPERLPGEIGVFSDTPKPNALVTLPLHGPGTRPEENPAREFSLKRPYLHDLLEKLRAAYDVRIVRTGNDRALYDALDATPAIALWIAGGHGDGYSVRLGPFSPGPIANVDAAYLDPGDTDIAQHAKNFRNDATILLLSCRAGIGGQHTVGNVANQLLARTGVERVFASRAEFMGVDLTVTTAFPFHARVVVPASDTAGGLTSGIVRFVNATYIAHRDNAFARF